MAMDDALLWAREEWPPNKRDAAASGFRAGHAAGQSASDAQVAELEAEIARLQASLDAAWAAALIRAALALFILGQPDMARQSAAECEAI